MDDQPSTSGPPAASDTDLLENPDAQERVYAFVREVPPGRVVTYGQVAASVSGVTLSPREVGAAMRYAPADVPWQRVVGAGGRLPIHKRSPEAACRQRRLLEEEGVPFLGDTDRIDMARVQWQGSESNDIQGGLFDE